MNHRTGIGICALLILAVAAAFAQDEIARMDEFRTRIAAGEKNFPPELSALLPKSFTLEARGLLRPENSAQLVTIALAGTRKNEVFKQGGLDSEIAIEIIVFAPGTEALRAELLDKAKREAGAGMVRESKGVWEIGPVTVAKFSQADVFNQKATRKGVPAGGKFEDHVYHFITVVLAKGDALLCVRVVYYPSKSDGALTAAAAIIKAFTETNFSKYLR